MGQPVVHFEIIGNDPERLRRYYRELFGWEFDASAGPAGWAPSRHRGPTS
jgi:predicted enzyme related to lactoylglutathione lyase